MLFKGIYTLCVLVSAIKFKINNHNMIEDFKIVSQTVLIRIICDTIKHSIMNKYQTDESL